MENKYAGDKGNRRDFKKPLTRSQLFEVMRYLGHDTFSDRARRFVDKYADLLMESGSLPSQIATGLAGS